MALVNANYKIIYVDVDCNGRISDGGVFKNTDLYRRLGNPTNPLNIPADSSLPGRNKRIPSVIVRDADFPLKPYLVKPYPGRGCTIEQELFSKRLSRARRIVENAFGHLASRFQILGKTIHLMLNIVAKFVLNCYVLDNFIRTDDHHSTDSSHAHSINLVSIISNHKNINSALSQGIRDEIAH